jgi:hypothetical protein
MKKIVFILTVGLAFGFVSCKKDRTCTCTYSNAGSSNTDTHVTTYTKVTKKSARNNCTSGTTYDQSSPASIQTRDCVLSK